MKEVKTIKHLILLWDLVDFAIDNEKYEIAFILDMVATLGKIKSGGTKWNIQSEVESAGFSSAKFIIKALTTRNKDYELKKDINLEEKYKEIEVIDSMIADLDKQIAQIDEEIEELEKEGDK